MKISKFIISSVLVLMLVIITTGCKKKEEEQLQEGSSCQVIDQKEENDKMNSDLKTIDITSSIKSLDDLKLPDKPIIGIGEATHGNKEFVELKLQVFQYLVNNLGYRVFALEGDFGGCQKVNEYILNGGIRAEEAVSEIGFEIYKIQEMAELVQWMYEFNQTVSDDDKIHFYGFDMQRYDNNKEGLINYIKSVDPDRVPEFEDLLEDLNDESLYDQEKSKIQAGIEGIEQISNILEDNKEKYLESSSGAAYNLAVAYALCIEQNAELRGTNVNYGNVRDQNMADKVSWILEYEKEIYGRDKIFLAGHNGHIEKTSATFGITSMGKHLSDKYADDYYAIGTEFCESTFLSKDSQANARKEFTVKNSGEERLATLFERTELDRGWIDIEEAKNDAAIGKILSTKQRMGCIGDEFSDGMQNAEMAYTLNMQPDKAYSAIIFIKNATPVHMIE